MLCRSQGVPCVDGDAYFKLMTHTEDRWHAQKTEANYKIYLRLIEHARNVAYAVWPQGTFAARQVVQSAPRVIDFPQAGTGAGSQEPLPSSSSGGTGATSSQCHDVTLAYRAAATAVFKAPPPPPEWRSNEFSIPPADWPAIQAARGRLASSTNKITAPRVPAWKAVTQVASKEGPVQVPAQPATTPQRPLGAPTPLQSPPVKTAPGPPPPWTASVGVIVKPAPPALPSVIVKPVPPVLPSDGDVNPMFDMTPPPVPFP